MFVLLHYIFFYLVSNWNFPCSNLCLLPLILLLCTSERSLAPSPVYSDQVVVDNSKFSLLLMLKRHSCLSLFLDVVCLSPSLSWWLCLPLVCSTSHLMTESSEVIWAHCALSKFILNTTSNFPVLCVF